MSKVIIKTKIDRKLNKQIQDGIYEAVMEVLDDAQAKMLSSNSPNVWEGNPRMQDELRLTGLDGYTIPGALLNAWHETISDIKIDRRYNKIAMNLFNDYKLNEATKWVGVNEKPKFRTRNRKTTGLKNNVTLKYGDSAYRPLSNGTGKHWDWGPNPYPGNGYWLYHEQGYGPYMGNPFVKRAYSYMLGNDAANLFDNSELEFNWVFFQRLVEACAKNVQREVNHGNI
ncbi:MAG: hypothetical protein PHN69_04140 [Candidatus Pacebacteria bacterium]|nr:hypothetical protein [Candidatus Paceibacterota bacterium]